MNTKAMYKYILLIFLFFTQLANAQTKEKVEASNISNILSFEDFQKIKQFILDKGKSMTYCTMYNDNPYYEFSRGIRVYLDPIYQSPKKQIEKSEYI